MHKIRLIAWREFTSRVRKKSFKIMTLLGPLFFAAILIIPIWLKSSESGTGNTILVLDNSGLFTKKLPDSDLVFFMYQRSSLEDAKLHLLSGNFTALLYVPADVLLNNGMVLYSDKKPPLRIQRYLQKSVAEVIHTYKIHRLLEEKNLAIPSKEVPEIRAESLAATYDTETGDGAGVTGFFLAILIYFFILFYGMQVMRSVMEEKNSRVVEVLISAIKPFELMMGKIIGVAMVSFLQFGVWLGSTSLLTLVIFQRFGKSLQLFQDDTIMQTINRGTDVKQALEMNELINAFHGMNPLLLLFCFLIYFFCGYLLYSSLFASIGSIVDSESDVQQFILPVTAPLFISFMLLSAVLDNPQGSLAFWLSVIPLTSPVVMMLRLPYGVPPIELIVSLLILAGSFLVSTWCAAKIYRAGILLYGKKISYVEIGRWLFSKTNS